MDYFQGDVVLVKFPFSNYADGKLRPALVVSNSSVNKTENLILAQMTTSIFETPFSVGYEEKDFSTPIKMGEIRCDMIFTAEKKIIKNKISTLSCDKQHEVFQKLNTLTSVDCKRVARAIDDPKRLS